MDAEVNSSILRPLESNPCKRITWRETFLNPPAGSSNPISEVSAGAGELLIFHI